MARSRELQRFPETNHQHSGFVLQKKNWVKREHLSESKIPLEASFLSPSRPRGSATDLPDGKGSAGSACELILQDFPNDLTRLIYLASLRDCNSGLYLHPQLSTQNGLEETDRALCACHDEVFRRLLITRVAEYVLQLEEYIRYTRADRTTVLKTWRSLQAYRATVPVAALRVFAELFCVNIEAALLILDETDNRAEAQEAWMRRCDSSNGSQALTTLPITEASPGTLNRRAGRRDSG